MIRRYCQTSTKYSLYCFQNFLSPLKKSIFLILLILINVEVFAQTSDTLSLKFKKSKILIINRNYNVDEWNFEDIDENLEIEKNSKELSVVLGAGWFSLNDANILNGKSDFNLIPHNKTNSNTQNITFYFKNLKLYKESIYLYTGLGYEIQRLNLGFNHTNITKDTLSFTFDGNFENNRNVLKSNYFIVPIGISFKIKNNLLAQLELNNHVLTNVKLDVKTENGENKNQVLTKGSFFYKRHYFSVRSKLIWKSFGVFAETSLVSTSNIFNNQFNFSCGLIICKYR